MANKWAPEIEKITDQFKIEFGTLSSEKLNWKPDAGKWSIAQNIDHIITVNETYFPLIASIRKGAYQLPWIAKIKPIVRFFGNFILKAVQPDRKKKVKTFKIWEPSTCDFPADIMQKFEGHQAKLKEVIEDSEDLIASNTIISSPANKI